MKQPTARKPVQNTYLQFPQHPEALVTLVTLATLKSKILGNNTSYSILRKLTKCKYRKDFNFCKKLTVKKFPA